MTDENTFDEDGYYEDDVEDMGHGPTIVDGEHEQDFVIGEEIPLTHEEIWDDSELLDTWDKAVKQYQVHHSKVVKEDTKSAKATPSRSSKTTTETMHAGPTLTKRARTEVSGEAPAGKRTATTSGANEAQIEQQPPQPQTAESKSSLPSSSLSSTDYAVSERKPSFKKADKPVFGHHKGHQQGNTAGYNNNHNVSNTKNKGIKQPHSQLKTKSSHANRSKSSSSFSSSAPAAAPVYDAATIAYYRQLGYTFDPSYASTSSSAATGQSFSARGGEEEDEEEEEEESTSSSAARQQEHRRPMSGAATQNSFAQAAAHQQTYAQSHANLIPPPFGGFSGYTPHIPMPPPPSGAQGIPGTSAWGRPPSMVFGSNAGGGPASGAGSHFPYPGMIPPGGGRGGFPPPPMPMAGGGAGSMVDDEALSNLIMAWWYSGYYTGRYQASQGR
ncbi:hypothetical protein BGZ83_008825 [Gryganskiella cystojenkinii]|nr:hypothetical protein BGZ83_008825 [Gryganskiella cystojenkinii]